MLVAPLSSHLDGTSLPCKVLDIPSGSGIPSPPSKTCLQKFSIIHKTYVTVYRSNDNPSKTMATYLGEDEENCHCTSASPLVGQSNHVPNQESQLRQTWTSCQSHILPAHSDSSPCSYWNMVKPSCRARSLWHVFHRLLQLHCWRKEHTCGLLCWDVLYWN